MPYAEKTHKFSLCTVFSVSPTHIQTSFCGARIQTYSWVNLPALHGVLFLAHPCWGVICFWVKIECRPVLFRLILRLHSSATNRPFIKSMLNTCRTHRLMSWDSPRVILRRLTPCSTPRLLCLKSQDSCMGSPLVTLFPALDKDDVIV